MPKQYVKNKSDVLFLITLSYEWHVSMAYCKILIKNGETPLKKLSIVHITVGL